jgi:hypothetical protein
MPAVAVGLETQARSCELGFDGQRDEDPALLLTS